MANSDCLVERSLLAAVDQAIGMSRAGYQGADNTCISTSLSVERVEAVLKSLVGSAIDEYDYAEMDGNRLDVWGYSDSTPENDCDWRIIIRYGDVD